MPLNKFNEKLIVPALSWLLPVLFLVLQAGTELAGLFALIIICTGLISKLTRPLSLLLALCAGGYLLWAAVVPMLSGLTDNPYFAVILGRFGLLGYLILFAVWRVLFRPETKLFAAGDALGTIQFPLIWKGRREPVWRFILIFCSMCLVPMVVAVATSAPAGNIILYGLLFSLINASLEEMLWRGFILERLVGLAGEKQGLVISALAFGLYHLSLGFSVWACLVFAVGGFYMGGVTIRARGLLPAFAMHVFVNMIFVLFGMIF